MGRLLLNKWSVSVLIVAFLVVNYAASYLHTRVDLTEENRFTIGKPTKDVLRQLEEPVSITVFLKGKLPSGFKKLANTTADFLQLLKETNSRNINFTFIAPDEKIADGDRLYQDTLVALGAMPINLTVQVKQGQESNIIYPYALIEYKGEQELVSLYSGKRMITQDDINAAEAMMEYKFLKVLNKFVHPQKPLVAYSFGNGEITDVRTYDLLQTLQKDYQLFTFDINKRAFIPDTFGVVMIVKPTLQFTEAEKLKIDQYLLKGGKVLCLIDNLHAEQDSLSIKPELIAYDRNLNLTDLFFKYGIRINTDLVMDLQCDFMPFAVGGTRENPQYEFLKWNYYPLFESKNNHPINKNIGLVAGRFVNSIDTVKAIGVNKTVLLSTSANARKLGTPALISLNENRNTPEDALFKQQDIPVAVLLEGRFTSLYKNRLSAQIIDSMQQQGSTFVTESVADGKMIVVADGDMVLNDASQKEGPLPMGMNLYTLGTQYEYQFANRDFLLNCLEYFTTGQGIMAARNKDVVLRLLNTKQINDEKTTWQFINILLPIAVVAIGGLLFVFIRKRKFGSTI